MKNRWKWLAVIAAALVLVASLGSAIAYFTTYAEADGRLPVNLQIDMRERFEDMTKIIQIEAAKDALPVYVRARAFYPADIGIESVAYETGTWVPEGDYYYCQQILYAGGQTAPIEIKIAAEGEEAQKLHDFNFVVVYECVRATDDEGEVIPLADVDWDAPLSNAVAAGGNE